MNPTPQELFASYPRATKAIAFVELILCSTDESETESSWDILMGANVGVGTAIECIRTCMRDALAGEGTSELRDALAQTESADFILYIAGKMGAM